MTPPAGDAYEEELAKLRARERSIRGLPPIPGTPGKPPTGPASNTAYEQAVAALRATERVILGKAPPPIKAPVEVSPTEEPAEVSVSPTEEPLPIGAQLGLDLVTDKPVIIPESERVEGLYIIGTQGKGKSSLLEDLIYQDLVADYRPGVCLLDPHLGPQSPLIDRILRRVPPHREADVIVVDINDDERFVGLNLLACDNPDRLGAITDTTEHVYQMFRQIWGPGGHEPESWGVQLGELLRVCSYTLARNPRMTLAEMPLLLEDAAFRDAMIQALNREEDQPIRDFWLNRFNRMGPSAQETYAGSTQRRLAHFVQSPLVRYMVGQSTSTIDFGRAMTEGKVILIQLNNDKPFATALVGSLIVGLIYSAALRRRAGDVRPFHLYADEFASFASADFAAVITQTRKFYIGTTVAHQGRWQLGGQNSPTFKATTGMNNMVVFHVQDSDAAELSWMLRLPANAQQATLVIDPYRHLETRGHSDERVLTAFTRLNSLLAVQQSDWDSDYSVARANVGPMLRDRRQPPIPVSSQTKMRELRAIMQEYLLGAMRGAAEPAILAKAWMVYSLNRPEFEDALVELGAALVDKPLTIDTGDAGNRGRVRQELTELDRYEAYCRVVVDWKTHFHKIRTPAFHPIDHSPEAAQRVTRIRELSRQTYTRTQQAVEAEIQERRTPPPQQPPTPKASEAPAASPADVPPGSAQPAEPAVEAESEQQTPAVQNESTPPDQRRPRTRREPLED